MDQLPAILAALVPILAAIAGIELRHRGRTKELIEDRRDAETRARGFEDRLEVSDAKAFRRLLLLRRILLVLPSRRSDPNIAEIRFEIEKETT